MKSTHKINTAMRNAFLNIKVKATAFKAANTSNSDDCINYLLHAEKRGSGITNVVGWNAALSFKTAGLLNAPIFDVNKHTGKRNAYDCMVA